jgi:FtsP/CotA-like multicopper oxidase with cupredoxin domain
MLFGGLSATLWTRCCGSGFAQSPATRLATDGYQLLDAGPARAEILAGASPAPAAFGYDGATPGPTLRLRKGAELKIRLNNKLSEPTSLCWAGLRTPNAMAGIAGLTQPPVSPGTSFDYRFTPPDSGFNLYQPHVGAATAGQIGRGLFGPLVVEEPSPPQVDLEVIAAFADWKLGPDGPTLGDDADPFPENGADSSGALRSVNGRAPPLTFNLAAGARVRLRLASAATGRIMILGVEGAKPLIVAIDGQPCEAFAPLRNAFPISPGARFDMLFDMPLDGAPVRFRRAGAGAAIAGKAEEALIAFVAAGDPVAKRPPMVGLEANPLLPQEIDLQRARRIDLTIAGDAKTSFAVNGAPAGSWPPKPLFSVPRGAPVVLGIVNNTAIPQALRLYGHVMRLLHPLDDGWEPYWRDSVLVAPGKTSHVAFVADNPGHWPIESAIPAHQAAGVRAIFAVG